MTLLRTLAIGASVAFVSCFVIVLIGAVGRLAFYFLGVGWDLAEPPYFEERPS